MLLCRGMIQVHSLRFQTIVGVKKYRIAAGGFRQRILVPCRPVRARHYGVKCRGEEISLLDTINRTVYLNHHDLIQGIE